MLAAGVGQANRQPYHVFAFGWRLVLIDWLAALALVISLGFRKIRF
nr:MAG TPA: hypothetical protein [Caudoviricetes sp.]DAP17578.1 MAG TPA: hypothetical protein [Caudoviricetes sp.]